MRRLSGPEAFEIRLDEAYAPCVMQVQLFNQVQLEPFHLPPATPRPIYAI